jgi:serine/threonine-protein kinase
MDLSGRTVGDQGRYLIERPLGAGAMGQVYLTVDQRLRKQVVLKVLRPEYASNPKVRERLRNEALIQANLEHPNIVRALDLVEEPDLFGIVIEYVHGASLDDVLEKEAGGPLPLARVGDLLLPVIEAVAFAHAQGVVHRDLKPGNILIDRRATPERPRVTDFGIAKLLSQAGRGLTREGAVLGTPHYMPPEQLKGAADLDGRADIYALGVILHHLASGRFPHGDASEYEVVHRVLNGERLPALAGVVPGVPAALDAVIARATEPDREQRYATADELRVDLKAALDGRVPAVASSILPPAVVAPPKPPAALTRLEEPDEAGPRAPEAQAVRFPAGRILAVLVVVAGLIGVIVARPLRRQPDVPADAVVQESARVIVSASPVAQAPSAPQADDGAAKREAERVAQEAAERQAAREAETRQQQEREARQRQGQDQRSALQAFAARHFASINDCDFNTYLGTLDGVLTRFYGKTGFSRDDVRRDLKKTFDACSVRVQLLDYDITLDPPHVRVWKRAQSLGKKKRDFCICSHLDLRAVGGGWAVTGVYDSPNQVDETCTRQRELCF